MAYTVTFDQNDEQPWFVSLEVAVDRAWPVYDAAPLRAGYRLTLTDDNGALLATRVGGDPTHSSSPVISSDD